MIEGIQLTNLNRIKLLEGDVLHCVKKDDPGYRRFGEVYFSDVNMNSIKAWKRHNKMTLNLVVPVGEVKFVIFDERDMSKTKNELFVITLSRSNYVRLTVPPGLWVGFQGIGKDKNMLVNVADCVHDPDESDRRDIDSIKYDWRFIK